MHLGHPRASGTPTVLQACIWNTHSPACWHSISEHLGYSQSRIFRWLSRGLSVAAGLQVSHAGPMARPRAQIVSPEGADGCYHCVQRCVRRACLFGNDESHPIIWDTRTPEFSDGFPADFLSQPTRKSAMLAAWLAYALKSFRRKPKLLRDVGTLR